MKRRLGYIEFARRLQFHVGACLQLCRRIVQRPIFNLYCLNGFYSILPRVRWTPEVGQAGSLTQSQNTDPPV